MVKGESNSPRRFSLRNGAGEEIGVFTGRSPRQAALKAANKAGGKKETPVLVMLREHGKKKQHVYETYTEQVPAPANKPSWLGDTITRPVVKKLRIEKLEKI